LMQVLTVRWSANRKVHVAHADCCTVR
jgi:hypothetical protein